MRSPGSERPASRRGTGPSRPAWNWNGPAARSARSTRANWTWTAPTRPALAQHGEIAQRLTDLIELHRAADRERSTWSARRDALALGLTRKDGAGALLADPESGVLGAVAALVSVEAGFEPALTAALGAVADAVAVASIADAGRVLARLKAADAGRAGVLVGGPAAAVDRSGWPSLPAGARWAVELVTAPDALVAAVHSSLDRVAVVDSLADARTLVEQYPDVRAVTRDGNVLGRNWAFGGSGSAPSALEVQAAVDEAEAKAGEAAKRYEQLERELAEVRQAEAERKAVVEQTLAALNESDARLNAVAERLAELAQTERSAAAEADRLDQARVAAEAARDADLAGLVELEERLRLAESESDPDAEEPPVSDRDERAGFVAAARQAEMDARLSVRTQEERARAMSGRADQLMRAATAERDARRHQEEARIRRARGAVVAAAVRQAAETALQHLERAQTRAAADRDRVQAARTERERALSAARTQVRELSGQLAKLTDAVHRDEVARAEQRLRIEQLEARAVDEYGLELEALLAEYGNDQPTPPSAQEMAEYEQAVARGEQVFQPQPGPFDRKTQERRASRAERDLALLGKVNPLALEEFAALEERHQFLATQLEDLKNTRRDLLTVVKEVDDKILEVFTAAYHDVAAEFEIVFATLFPGGEGRLVLTQPDDMLLTGIEVEARPPGKKVKRLSLLSGGERSLTAVAMLVAIFRARPSPFYVMDEVEAALDDVNLGRLVGLIGELRASSQLIIITHQKRTMEVADALYGVTMRGDGITQVISQRLRDGAEPVPAPVAALPVG